MTKSLTETIQQIGGRERLEQYAFDKHMCNINEEIRLMARALLAVLDAQSNPVAYLIRDKEDRKDGRLGTLSFTGAGSYSDDDINEYELCDTPLYTTPPAASVPDGWKLMPLKASPEILQAGIKAHYERQKYQQPEDVKFKGPMECAYDDMLSAAPAPGGDGG